MRKQKTRKSAIKRFKITKSGKVLHRHHYLRHLRSQKSKRHLRRLKETVQVTGRYEKKIKRMMGVK
jgi:large subunit ribosomal protein L35